MADNDSKSKREQRRERRRKEDSQAKGWLREWADALLFAVIAALIIRTFLFEAYRIPTPSMEDTLMTGDFLVVSKINYGARTPMVLAIPFTNIYLPGVTLPWTRLPGLTEIERNDIVVFNYPIDIAPIAAKTSYVKRAVGMPGDTLEIREQRLFVNGDPAEQFPGMQQQYLVEVQPRVRLSQTKVETNGGRLLQSTGQNSYLVNMPLPLAEDMESWPEVTSVELAPNSPQRYSNSQFSFSRGFTDGVPQLTVPQAGQTVTLTPQNWHIYENIITRYERNNVERNGSTFIINGEETNQYTIKDDYYFMMGDNRDNSLDSRYWGFVPGDHIVGEASVIYFSWDSERMLPRFDRIFNIIR